MVQRSRCSELHRRQATPTPPRKFLKEPDPVRETIPPRPFTPDIDRIIRLDCINASRAELAREQRKQTRTTTEIEHHPIRLHCFAQRRHVRIDARRTGHHLAIEVKAIHATARNQPTIDCKAREAAARPCVASLAAAARARARDSTAQTHAHASACRATSCRTCSQSTK